MSDKCDKWDFDPKNRKNLSPVSDDRNDQIDFLQPETIKALCKRAMTDYDEAAAELTRLRERITELEAREVRYQEALEAYEAEIATFNERYASLEARTAELENESVALWTIVSKCADALGNGGAISYDCSIAFMGELPSEIGLHVASLTEDRDTWKSRAQQFQRECAELSDKLNGTPCAEIRWQYERDALRDENRTLREILSLAESVYRKNCVAEGEPSSVLGAIQAALTTLRSDSDDT